MKFTADLPIEENFKKNLEKYYLNDDLNFNFLKIFLLKFTSLIGYTNIEDWFKGFGNENNHPSIQMTVFDNYFREYENKFDEFESFLFSIDEIWPDWHITLGESGAYHTYELYKDFPVRFNFSLKNINIIYDVQGFYLHCSVCYKVKSKKTKEIKGLFSKKNEEVEVIEERFFSFFPFAEDNIKHFASLTDKSILERWKRPFSEKDQKIIKKTFDMDLSLSEYEIIFNNQDLKEKYFEEYLNRDISPLEFLLDLKFFDIEDDEYDFLYKLIRFIQEMEQELINLNNKEQNQIKDLQLSINNLDKNNNGVIDIIESSGVFEKLVKKNQPKIIDLENGKTYIQKFVKISNYLKSKRDNIQNVFNWIKENKNSKKVLNDRVAFLNDNIKSYETLTLHSFNMIASLINDDVFTFYEIYEVFDKLNVFDSNYERQLAEKLSEINEAIDSLMIKLNRIDNNIIQTFNELSYLQEESYRSLNESISKELNDIGSSIDLNTLLTGINTYQSIKLNLK
jgi:hypothetical protein